MRALVLSGGGANGAYQVGALKHLLLDLHIQYDIICGVSVGALNGSFIAQFPKGEEAQAYRGLRVIWEQVDNPVIYKKWYWGLLWYLPVLWKSSIYDSSPLHKLVRSNLEPRRIRESGRRLRVISVELNSGKKYAWAEDNPDVVDGVLASSAFPIYFLPVESHGALHTDGGVRDITPLGQAIKLGATEIDVIVCHPEKMSYDDQVGTKIWHQGLRDIEIAFNEISEGDLRITKMYNKMCKAGVAPEGIREVLVRTIRPCSSNGDSLDFSPEKNERLFQRGYRDAVETGIVDG
jgi:NTE family protein